MGMPVHPLVSVLMTSYNRQKYIAAAIESVLYSTYGKFELIIVDDCSSDETYAIASAYAEKDRRIKLYQNEKNLTQFPNRNKAAALATGEILMHVDSDDTIKPDAIEYVVKQFEVFPNASFALVYGQNDINLPVCLSPADSIRKHFFKSNHLLVGPGGSAMRTDFFKKIGGFPEIYGPAGDCYFNIKAASNTDTLSLPYIFFNYRLHGDQEFFSTYSYLYNGYRYYADALALPELPLNKEERKKLLAGNRRRFLYNCLMYVKTTGRFADMLRAFKLAGFGANDWFRVVFCK